MQCVRSSSDLGGTDRSPSLTTSSTNRGVPASSRSRRGAGWRSSTVQRSSDSGESGGAALDRLVISSICSTSGGDARSLRQSKCSKDRTSWSGRSHTPDSVALRPDHTSAIIALVAGRGQATGEVGMAALDPDHPVLFLIQVTDSYTYSRVIAKIQVINPCQILLPNTFCDPSQPLYRLLCEQFGDISLTSLPRHHFQSEAGLRRVTDLCLPSLANVITPLKNMYYCATAASALLIYLESVKSVVFRAHTLKVEFQAAEATVLINSDTCRRLELVQTRPGGRLEQTVYGIMKRTQTAGGCRRLRAELMQPSVSQVSIRTRQDCVQELVDSTNLLYRLRAVIGRFRDVEKIHSFCIQQHDWDSERNVEQRLNSIISLKSSLEFVEVLRESLQPAKHPFFVSMRECLEESMVASLLTRLRAVIHDDVQPCRGGIEQRVQRCYVIKSGINGMLDAARRLYSEVYDEFVTHVSQLGEQHRLTLRAGYSTTLGFHGVACSGRSGRLLQLPEEFIQVQQSKSSVTFTTERIVQMNSRSDASISEIYQLSNIVVCQLLNDLQPHLCFLYQLAEVVSTTDLLVGFAELAVSHGLQRPEFGDRLAINGGWHPLLSSITLAVLTDLDMGTDCRLAVITGGNMSGKSTLLKQVAVTQIMAQMGSFVPAQSAMLPIVDQIFCRSDCEERTERHASSFMAEMRDVSCVLQQATSRSLVLMDELGRATATEQGVAITWAVCEQLLRRRCRTLVATHFQQCCQLAETYGLARNLHVGACKQDETEPERAADAASHLAHRVYSGPLRRTGYGLSLAASTSLPTDLVEHAGHLLRTALLPPRPIRLSEQWCQERDVTSLADRLLELSGQPDLDPGPLKQALSHLRQAFVQSQMDSRTGSQH